MDARTLIIFMFSVCGVGIVLIFGFLFVRLRKNKGTSKDQLRRSLDRSGAKNSALGKTAFYQKVYLKLATTPFISRYLFKTRMRLEMVGNDDEYHVRAEAGQTTLRAIILTIVLSAVLMYINRESLFMMISSIIAVLIIVENITERSVTKIEDKLLNQQLDLFSEVRHAYHETNMVEEAIYDASLLEENEVNFQADKIYNVLIAPDSETELEKYYDVAPNRFLKVFAGISYLTREFGDRKVNDTSLYLKNMNNVTQELQLEILKRNKIDYQFRSLSIIALGPILFIQAVKAWGEGNFAATMSFYEGKGGFAVEVLLLVMILACYALLKRVKDNSNDARFKVVKENPWQNKLYHIPVFEQFIDKLMPKAGKKEYVKIRKLLKDSASKLKMEWFYVNRVVCALVGFLAVILLFNVMHSIAIQNVMEQTTMTEKVVGSLSDRDKLKGDAMTSYDSYSIQKISANKDLINRIKTMNRESAIMLIADELRLLKDTLQSDEEIEKDADMIYRQYGRIVSNYAYKRPEFQKAVFNAHINYTRDDYTVSLIYAVEEHAYQENDGIVTKKMIFKSIKEINSVPLTEDQIQANAIRIYDKIALLTSETLQWTELLVAILFAYFMYFVPVIVLKFQVMMRRMDMEDEVMQYQTVILMLMHIERVSVEYILEWLERFAVIFKEPISTCMNNYDAGAYEALEQLKDDAPYKPLVRIVESLQSAVENVKISDAFDELETDRNFFQEKRKEANERLISKKVRIGKLLGFAPMVVLFVAYLILPLLVVSVLDMGSYFSQMGTMM
ncbi:MAG: hypothetical protein IKI57_00895 [Clostridia bacterium]|nr:hypothetical protein [Clostridia bacterium]